MLLGILAAFLAGASARAQSPLAAKKAEAAQAFAEVQSLDASLSVADERMNLANLQLASVRHDLVVNKHELVVAKLNLAKTQKAIAQRLVNLYTGPQTSTLEIILGSSSLNDMLTQVDNASRISSLETQVLSQVYTFKGSVKRHQVALVREQAQARRLVAQRLAEQRAVAAQLAERRRLLSSLNGEVATLEAEAEAQALQQARQARARMMEAQGQANQSLSDAVVGALSSPEAAAIVPSSGYSGVVGVAMQYLGTPYVWGGASPAGFDCSGLVMFAYQAVGISLPHSSYAMWNYGVPVPVDQLQPGDLVFFDALNHVGIYLGNGELIDAPHTGSFVRIEFMSDPWYASHYVGARRV